MRELATQNITEEATVAIKELVLRALDRLYADDHYLIANCYADTGSHSVCHVGERPIVFQFAHYLQNLMDEDKVFQGLNLDCEYNRNGRTPKVLPSNRNGVFPDVIVHERGSNSRNILVMEFKTYWNRDTTDDETKLIEFTDLAGEYGFYLGYSVLIMQQRQDVQLKCFQNGRVIPCL